MIAHNVYINLDLAPPQLSFQKVKAFVGYGNNCNMIKGLIKRRFWWTLSEELTTDCVFVWTQLKVNKIYQRQELAPVNEPQYVEDLDLEEERKRVSKTCQPIKRKSAIEATSKKAEKRRRFDPYEHNSKLWNEKDMK
jgi:hypothetical protein